MTHSEYPVLRKIFLQWMFVERLVPFVLAETFFKEITSSVEFGSDLDNEKGELSAKIQYFNICFRILRVPRLLQKDS